MNERAREIVVACVADMFQVVETDVTDGLTIGVSRDEFDYLCLVLSQRGIRELGLTWEVNSQITVGEVVNMAVLMENEAA